MRSIGNYYSEWADARGDTRRTLLATLVFVSPAHCGRIPYWPLLAATLAQRAHFGLLLGPQ
jgi:hypothetical protein